MDQENDMIDISKLSKEELIQLNQKIVDRLNHISEAEILEQKKSFNVTDIVSFDNNGKKCFGVILRVNQKSITIAISSSERWKISPSFLRPVKNPPQKAKDLQFNLFPYTDPEKALKELGWSNKTE